MYALYAIFSGLIFWAISFIITIVVAIISSSRNEKKIWVYGIYAQLAILLVFLLSHYLDGSYYCRLTTQLVEILISLAGIALIGLLVHLLKIKRWKPFVWVFSFIIPILVFVIGFDLTADARPYSKKDLESILNVELPKYRVESYEEHSPGGDDWECNCSIRMKNDADLTGFIQLLEDKCQSHAGTFVNSDEFEEWRKVDNGYSFFKRYDIEHSLSVNLDVNDRTITYRYLKI